MLMRRCAVVTSPMTRGVSVPFSPISSRRLIGAAADRERSFASSRPEVNLIFSLLVSPNFKIVTLNARRGAHGIGTEPNS